MNKIVAAVDAAYFSAKQLESFLFVSKQAGGKLTIVSLEDVITQDFPIANIYSLQYAQLLQDSITEHRRLQKEHMDRLYLICDEMPDDIHVHETSGTPLSKVISESRFADLLMLNKTTSFGYLYKTDPPKFVKDVLVNAQCPVMILPDKITAVEKLIFTCNGSFSSIYAIRQFTLLFPNMSDIPVELVYVRESNKYQLPKENLIMDYLDHHYDDVQLTVLDGDPPAVLSTHLSNHKHCLATYGAYGRSGVSRFFRHSDAEQMLHTLNIPLFITHP